MFGFIFVPAAMERAVSLLAMYLWHTGEEETILNAALPMNSFLVFSALMNVSHVPCVPWG